MGALTRIAAVVLLAAGAAAAVFFVARGGSAPSLRPYRAVSVRASFDRGHIDFGDTVLARTVVKLDRRRVDVGSLKIRQSLFPFTSAGPKRTAQTTRGRVVVVTTEEPISCVQETCLFPKDSRVFRFTPVEVTVARHSGGKLTQAGSWPRMTIRRRTTEADLRRRPPPFRAYSAALPVTYAVSPSRLALWLEIAAVLLAAGGVLVAGASFNAFRRARRPRQRQIDELARAIAYAREAEVRPPEDRRKAAGLLARILGGRHQPLAGSAERLAWSRPVPTADALEDLVATTEQEVNGR